MSACVETAARHRDRNRQAGGRRPAAEALENKEPPRSAGRVFRRDLYGLGFTTYQPTLAILIACHSHVVATVHIDDFEVGSVVGHPVRDRNRRQRR